MENDLHVVFGTGPVGLATVDLLVDRRHRVRAVNRNGQAEVAKGVEVLGGDATDPAFSTHAARGAAVVYQCLNPPYTKWPEMFPPLQAGVVEGAAAQAKLVAMENLNMYGGPTEVPRSPKTSRTQPPAPKGRPRPKWRRTCSKCIERGESAWPSVEPPTISAPMACSARWASVCSTRP